MRRQAWWQVSFTRNLFAGGYNPIARLNRIRTNLARRSPTQLCCGNYGEPGC
ncbi:MAG TPA: hypothetical protein VGT01_01210 [Candidatus Dormibacteraeota bacterium]|nr:hypothetical protein [Candidatus Dormibacteraeota bacterium]